MEGGRQSGTSTKMITKCVRLCTNVWRLLTQIKFNHHPIVQGKFRPSVRMWVYVCLIQFCTFGFLTYFLPLSGNFVVSASNYLFSHTFRRIHNWIELERFGSRIKTKITPHATIIVVILCQMAFIAILTVRFMFCTCFVYLLLSSSIIQLELCTSYQITHST